MRLCLLFSLLVVSCTQKPIEKKIRVTGSSTVAPLLSEIAKSFEALNPEIRIDVQTGGSSRGIMDARKKTADIGMVSRALGAKESDLKSYTIAKDGVGLIVHKDISVEKIDSTQIRDIYQKKTANWAKLGGSDLKITVINKAQGRSTAEVFIDYLGLKYTDISADIIIGDNEQGIKNVATIPGAIGYVSIGAAEQAIRSGSHIKLLRLDGVESSTQTVASGQYPISRELNLVTHKDQDHPTVIKFLEFAGSETSHATVRRLDFVPIKL